MSKIKQITSNIQSLPSTRAYSTSFSAGKYSGIGMGSVYGVQNELGDGE